MPAETIELRPTHSVRYVDGDTEFTRHPDGSEDVNLYGADDSASALGAGPDLSGYADESFSSNLAELMSPSQRHWLADRLVEYHRADLESREDWDALTRQGLQHLGIDKIDASRLPFPGAASVQHPVIAEACVQFSSNAIEEFFPPTGPVKGDIAGEATPEIEDQVERSTDFMNYYLTDVDKGYYADSDQMLFYLPIAGSVFRKAWLDPRDQMPRLRYVKAEDFVAPYFARDLENCSRYCHQYQMEGIEIRRSMLKGEFLQLKLQRPSMEGEDTAKEKMDDKADRRVRVLHVDDELYDMLEYHIDLNLAAGIDELDDGELELPYVVVVDRSSREILSIRRNWKQNDANKKKRVWFTHYKFLPGLGFYGFGFLHVIGSLADAISGSVRAILDSALMATIQGGFRAKDGAKRGGSIAIEPGKWKDIDASSEELSKTFYTPPLKEPSPALVQLMESMVQDARRFASITEVLVGEADNKAPVGTTIALIEQSMKLFTAIHKRIYAAARQEFEMLAQLIHDFAPFKEYPYYLKGQAQTALQSDFNDLVDFLPVADPNIVSDVQRIALAQALIQLVQQFPQLFSPEQQVEVVKRFLKALKVPDAESLEPQIPTATYLDPVGENMQMLVGKPVRAFPGQAHAAHHMVHTQAIGMAQNTMPPDQFQKFYMIVQSHLREHEALAAYEAVSAKLKGSYGTPLPPVDIYGPNENEDPATERAISILASQNLPPLPPPLPGSMAAQQNAQPPNGPAAAAAQTAASIQQRTEAQDAANVAKIDRDTMDFTAQYHQRDQEHAQRMRQEQELHELRMKHQDAETAAGILRESAKGKVARFHQSVESQSRLAIERKRATTAEGTRQQVTESRLAHDSEMTRARAKLVKTNGANRPQAKKPARKAA